MSNVSTTSPNAKEDDEENDDEDDDDPEDHDVESKKNSTEINPERLKAFNVSCSALDRMERRVSVHLGFETSQPFSPIVNRDAGVIRRDLTQDARSLCAQLLEF